jgi:hypothetical protein
MWDWSLNWGEVAPGILIGTCPMTPEDLRRIRQETATEAVLSLQHQECLAYWGIDYARMRRTGAELGVRMERCPMRDFDVVDQRRHLPDAVSALAGLQARGCRTYVHCTAGLGRAPLTVLTYLILVAQLDPEAAIALIRAARPGAVPAWEAYRGCRRDLVSRHREAIAERAFGLHAQGLHTSADLDWLQAETEVLREMLLRGGAARTPAPADTAIAARGASPR